MAPDNIGSVPPSKPKSDEAIRRQQIRDARFSTPARASTGTGKSNAAASAAFIAAAASSASKSARSRPAPQSPSGPDLSQLPREYQRMVPKTTPGSPTRLRQVPESKSVLVETPSSRARLVPSPAPGSAKRTSIPPNGLVSSSYSNSAAMAAVAGPSNASRTRQIPEGGSAQSRADGALERSPSTRRPSVDSVSTSQSSCGAKSAALSAVASRGHRSSLSSGSSSVASGDRSRRGSVDTSYHGSGDTSWRGSVDVERTHEGGHESLDSLRTPRSSHPIINHDMTRDPTRAAARAAAKHSLEQPTSVEPRVPFSSKFASGLAAALKRDQALAPQEPIREHIERDALEIVSPLQAVLWQQASSNVERDTRRLSRPPAAASPTSLSGAALAVSQQAGAGANNSKRRPDLEPRISTDSTATTSSGAGAPGSALSAALAARSRAESRMARIYMDLANSTDAARPPKRAKRYRPAAQWSTRRPRDSGGALHGADGFGTTLRAHNQRQVSPPASSGSPQTTSNHLGSNPLGRGGSGASLPLKQSPNIHSTPSSSPGTTHSEKHKPHKSFWGKLFGAGSSSGKTSSSSKDVPTPAPQQPQMVQTLRTGRGRKNFNSEKPWKHHGDARYVAERERKRYERVWAANRGSHMRFFVEFDDKGSPVFPPLAGAPMFHPVVGALRGPMGPVSTMAGSPLGVNSGPISMDTVKDTTRDSASEIMPPPSSSTPQLPTDRTPLAPRRSASSLASADSASAVSAQSFESADEDIHGYVVAQLWRRSCLPDDTLARVWDLVDTNKDGTLDRASFVMGMWLLDQCLYGRKLPNKVDTDVWQSVGKLHLEIRVDGRPHHRGKFVKRVPRVAVKGAAKGGAHIMRKAVASFDN